MLFENMELDPRLIKAIAGRGYTETTDVQERTLAITIDGRDTAVQSQTGTGKTAAFLITVFQRLLEDPSRRKGRTLIIAPTRELAAQIEHEAMLLGRSLGFRIGSFYGGVGYERQMSLLRKGVDVIIGTPGRLLDLDEKGVLRPGDIRILVIDEADRLLDMGFLPDIKRIVAKCPPREKRQSLFFSATLDRVARKIAGDFLNDPEFLELSANRVTVDSISQELYHVGSRLKADLLLGLLKEENPKSAIIFTNTRHGAERLARRLERNGHDVRHLTGSLPQTRRMRIMSDFAAGRFPCLVATDVAARGLDIDDLELVVNYDLPQDIENYVHRIGRTGRNGKSGKAVTLACEKFVEKLPEIQEYIGMKIPVKPIPEWLYEIEKNKPPVESTPRFPVGRRSGQGRGRDDRGKSGGRRQAARSTDRGRSRSGQASRPR